MEYEVQDIFQELDEEIRKLLTLTHEIRIDVILDNDPEDKIKRALSLIEHIRSNLLRVRK
ncbi:protein D-63 [Saccharolobus islandicus]|uniref:protein D-63 n=1 Tax=Saccharolobus islandicus TaxID=43080 RepID=UPI000ABD6572|nr:protein D-63 [Sulfolobus islandicus]